jgi:hypothetical protein
LRHSSANNFFLVHRAALSTTTADNVRATS